MSLEISYQKNRSRVEERQGRDYDFIPVKRNEESFYHLYNSLYLPVFHFAKRFVSSEDAEDVTSETFFKLWKSDVDLSIVPKVKTWLQVCTRNACIDLIKEKKLKNSKQNDFAYFSELNIESEIEIEIRERLLERLNIEIEKLPRRSKQVFKMAYLERQSSRQIASTLGISENTVSNHRLSAMKSLKLTFRQQIWLLLLIFSSISSVFAHLT